MVGRDPAEAPDGVNDLIFQGFKVAQDEGPYGGAESIGGEADTSGKDASAVLCFFEIVGLGEPSRLADRFFVIQDIISFVSPVLAGFGGVFDDQAVVPIVDVSRISRAPECGTKEGAIGAVDFFDLAFLFFLVVGAVPDVFFPLVETFLKDFKCLVEVPFVFLFDFVQIIVCFEIEVG